MQPDRRKARAALASAAARASRNPGDPAASAAVIERRRDYWATELEEHIQRVVDAAPLSDEQLDRLVGILKPASRRIVLRKASDDACS